MSSHLHHAWLKDWHRSVQEEYERLHREARSDIQRAGHGGESTWVRLLEHWLPDSYKVATRKYIIPEAGDEMFETDIVVFNPGYPKALHSREKVMAGGVAAAFSVKLTLDADGIRDGIERAALLRRGLRRRLGSPRSELVPPLTVGILAHSHDWKAPASNPVQNIRAALDRWDAAHVQHPLEVLDCICVADLSFWHAVRIPYLPAATAAHISASVWPSETEGAAVTSTMEAAASDTTPIAKLVAMLYERFSYHDPQLCQVADGLALTETLGGGHSDRQRMWKLSDVYSEHLMERIAANGYIVNNTDWKHAYL